MLDSGTHLRMEFEPWQKLSSHKAVNEFVEHMKSLLEEACVTSAKAKDKISRYYDWRWTIAPTLELGSQVYLDAVRDLQTFLSSFSFYLFDLYFFTHASILSYHFYYYASFLFYFSYCTYRRGVILLFSDFPLEFIPYFHSTFLTPYYCPLFSFGISLVVVMLMSASHCMHA
jgi:hypothetical protein